MPDNVDNLQVLANSLTALLQQDPSVVVLGEDVAQGSMLGLTQSACQDPQLAARLLPCPLTTLSWLSHAGGLALGGNLPVALLSGVGDLSDALAQLRELGRYNWRGGDTRALPMVVLVPVGPGLEADDDVHECPEAMLSQLRGIEVLTVGRGQDLPAALPSALAMAKRSEAPVALLVPRSLLLAPAPAHPRSPSEELSTISVHQVGGQGCVFCWGAAAAPTLAAAQSFSDLSVIELHQLAPLDTQAILAHAQQSGRVVIAHAGSSRLGLGAQLAALLADEAILHLDAPVTRVGGEDGAHASAHAAIPSPAAIHVALEATLQY